MDRKAKELLEFFRLLPDVKRVILFGSYASGTQSPGSDIDVCLVVHGEESKDGIRETIAGKVVEMKLLIHPLILTVEEFEIRKQMQPFQETVLRKHY